MRIRGIGTAKRIAGWARSYYRRGPLILGYHRVAESSWDPQQLCVSPENFASQLEILTSKAAPVSIEKLVATAADGKSLERSFVVTIDDGYADTAEVAAPILERYSVPSTVFVTTGMINGHYWWCEIQDLVENSVKLPDEIALSLGEHQFAWKKSSDTVREHVKLVRALGDLFRSLPFDVQDEALQEIRAVFESSAPNGSGVKAMSAEQIASLADSELVEIGSHMVTHTSLNQLEPEEQKAELQKSKAELEEISGRPIVSCSYPNGRISRQTPEFAKELGYTSGCTSQEELVSPGCDPMLLPRLWVGDWDSDQFSRWLKWWLR